MIVDTRHLMFSPEALRAVVKTYRALFPQKQPLGELGPILIRQTAPLVLGVQVLAPGANGYREVEIQESELAAMLILYCREARIPLPRSGSKAIEMNGEHVVLVTSKAIPTRSGPL